MSQATAALRRDYYRDMRLEWEAAADPLAQFRRWFDDALAGEIYEPNAMALATVAPGGQPSLRMVLLKDLMRAGSSSTPTWRAARRSSWPATLRPRCSSGGTGCTGRS